MLSSLILTNKHGISDAGTERHLMSFVLRDSPTAFVNVTCWGGENYIRDLHRSFCIGDVGECKEFMCLNIE